MRILVLIAGVLFLLPVPTKAQWTNIAPQLVRPDTYYGALHYKDGTLWAGSRLLWRSRDSGRTWTNVSGFLNPNETIRDISFRDRNTGLVCTSEFIYITRDGGTTWTRSLTHGLLWRATYHRSTNTIYVISNSGIDNFLTSFDGGINWSIQTLPGEAQAVNVAVDGTVYALSYNPLTLTGTVIRSEDFGSTWAPLGQVDHDCYTLEVDSCEARQLYLVNEDFASSRNNLSEIFCSSDAGQTWAIPFSQPVDYLAGSMTSSQNVQYVATLWNGILRSTDRGKSWVNIGGPGNVGDSRSICAINDSMVFAMDSAGSIWYTPNSGGFALPAFPPPGVLTISPDTLFAYDTVYVCDTTISRSVNVTRGDCAPYINNVTLLGTTNKFRIASRTTDAIHIDFTPGGPGQYTGALLLRQTNGTVDTVWLSGISRQEAFTMTLSRQSLFDLDSIKTCDSIRAVLQLAIAGCPEEEVIGYSIAGAVGDYSIIGNARDTISDFDSVTVQFLPKALGNRDATLLITRRNGSTTQVPLRGVGLSAGSLRLITEDRYTDTIGGSVRIPITIAGLITDDDIEVTLRYEEGLVYDGSFSPNGIPLDIPGTASPGRSRIRLISPMSNSPAGYATFSVFADSGATPQVWFDSLAVVNAVCLYDAQGPAISTVTQIAGCGISILTRFLRTGELPELTVRPNPAENTITIAASGDAGMATCAIYSERGERMLTTHVNLRAATVEKVDVSSLPSGSYFLHISTLHATTTLPLVIVR